MPIGWRVRHGVAVRLSARRVVRRFAVGAYAYRERVGRRASVRRACGASCVWCVVSSPVVRCVCAVSCVSVFRIARRFGALAVALVMRSPFRCVSYRRAFACIARRIGVGAPYRCACVGSSCVYPLRCVYRRACIAVRMRCVACVAVFRRVRHGSPTGALVCALVVSPCVAVSVCACVGGSPCRFTVRLPACVRAFACVCLSVGVCFTVRRASIGALASALPCASLCRIAVGR